MKHILISLCLLILVSTMVQAQHKSGTIKYTHTTYIDMDKMPPNMAIDMPKSFDGFMQLKFDQHSSLYEKDAEYKEEVNPNDNTPRMFKRMRERSNKVIYKNTLESMNLEQVNLFGKDFLVSDSITKIQWKVSAGEQKVIQGYTCMKASFKDSTSNFVIFFTPQLPVSAGPDKYSGLPGVILEVQSAQVHIMATKVELGDVAINPPSKGEKLTAIAFEKLREEKMKEQREMWG